MLVPIIPVFFFPFGTQLFVFERELLENGFKGAHSFLIDLRLSNAELVQLEVVVLIGRKKKR